MKLFVGLDLGTTAIKAAAYDENARLAAAESVLNPVTVNPDGASIVEADELVFASNRCLETLEKSLEKQRLAGIGISSSMFSILPVDADDRPLEPSRTWTDTTLQNMTASDEPRLYELTGCRVYPAYPRDRIRWTADRKPELFHKTAKWVSLAEYLFHSLTDRWAVSRSIASSTGLLDIRQLVWAQEALDYCGISQESLSPLTDETFSVFIKDGPFAGVPLAIGATDGPLCHLGTDSLGPGEMTSTVGTSGALRMVSNRPVLDPQMRTWCYYLTNGNWVYGGAINGGAIALQWFRENILRVSGGVVRGADPMIVEALSKVEPGCDGLTFLPSLTGERFPDWDPLRRGGFYGLSIHHNRLHLMRSIVEGIVFRLYSMFLALKTLGRDPDRIRASGGYTETREWLQVQADVFGRPIELTSPDEPSAFGAACLAAQAAEASSAGEFAQNVRVKNVITPRPELYDIYQSAYQRSERLYTLSKPGIQTVASTTP